MKTMPVKPTWIASIDAMRVLAMLGVILLHSPWRGDAGAMTLDSATLLQQLARFAVPFFFVISGYLWAAKCSSADDYRTRSVALSKRALVIFCFWSLLYGIELVIRLIRHEGISSTVEAMASVVYPFEPLGFVNSVLQGPVYHLWFLPALAVAAVISGAFLSRGNERLLMVLAIALFVVGLAGSAYAQSPCGFIVNFNFRNGPFFSLLMFVSGYVLHRYGQRMALLPIGTGLAFFGFGLQLVECTWLHQTWGAPFSQDYVLGTFFFGLGMSMIALSNAPFLRQRWLTSIGPLILGVYVSHVFFVARMRPLERIVHEPNLRQITYLASVFVLALITSAMLARWPRTRQFVA